MKEPEWLDRRFSFDEDARNSRVETAALVRLTTSLAASVIDLGAGVGGNIPYYFSRLPQFQRWTLVEPDPELRAATPGALHDWAHQLGGVAVVGETTQITLPGEAGLDVTCVEGHVGSLANLMAAHDEVDIVVGNAVLEHLPRADIATLLDTLGTHRAPLLATLNYVSTEFYPIRDEDAFWIARYDARFGEDASGARAGEILANEAAQRGFRVIEGASRWELRGGHHYQLQRMLVSELRRAAEVGCDDPELLRAWSLSMEARIASGAIDMTVNHLDVFVCPLRA